MKYIPKNAASVLALRCVISTRADTASHDNANRGSAVDTVTHFFEIASHHYRTLARCSTRNQHVEKVP
jgi:hypothetical protein